MRRIFFALVLFPLGLAQAQTPSASDIRDGKRIWQGYLGLENDCKLCHGEHGEGGFAKPLAGHRFNNAQFLRVVRQGAGKTMPAFVADKNLNDQQIDQVAAYLASLPKPAEPGTMWRTPVPPLATPRQKLYVESGCGQCHAAIFANPRRTAGGLGGDYEWFKTGRPGKGLTAEYITVTLPLLRGRDPEEVTTIVEATTGGGYTGIHRDPITNTNAAEFEVPKLGPQEKRTFTITLSGIGANSGIPRGTVKWERPRLGSGGTDLIAISTPLGR